MLLEVRRAVTACKRQTPFWGLTYSIPDLDTGFGVSLRSGHLPVGFYMSVTSYKKPEGKTSSQQSHFTDRETEAQRGSSACLRLMVVNWESWDWNLRLLCPESLTLSACKLADAAWPGGCVRKGTCTRHEGPGP